MLKVFFSPVRRCRSDFGRSAIFLGFALRSLFLAVFLVASLTASLTVSALGPSVGWADDFFSGGGERLQVATGGGGEGKTGNVSVEDLQVSTPTYEPQFADFDPPLGTYTYEVSWQGIPAAEATVTVSQDDMSYAITATARTYSAIDLLYYLRYKATGIISALDLSPRSTAIEHLENSKLKTTSITFHENGEIESTRVTKGKDSKYIKFNPHNGTLDPFSAAFLARSLEWHLGETKSFDTYNGKTRYLIKLTASKRKTIWFEGRGRDCWVIAPEVNNLNEPQASKKLREARIYVTADKSREILKIESEVFIGTVTTTLVSFQAAPPPPPQVVVALQQRRDALHGAS